MKQIPEHLKEHTFEPRRGAIAYCSVGLLGLITSEEPTTVTYEDGTSAEAWTGVQLMNTFIKEHPNGPHEKTVGGPWSSRTPVVVGYVDDVDAFLDEIRARFRPI